MPLYAISMQPDTISRKNHGAGDKTGKSPSRGHGSRIRVRSELSIFGDDYDTPDGTCIRDYVHVSDLADAHIRALDYISNENSSIMVNLGSENGISVKTMVEKAREVTGREIPSRIAPRRPGDPAKLVASSQLARKLLGWVAKYSDAETLIRSTWKVYQNSVVN